MEIRTAAHRAKASQNLKQISLAIHNYHDTYGKLPGPIRDDNGKPLLSWRVTILPHFESHDQQYRFKLEEPWDSPHNLAQIFPYRPYQTHAMKADSTLCHYRLVTGEGTAFEREGLCFDDIKDGLANTIFVVEAAEPVIWTKPDELDFSPIQPLPRLGGLFASSDWRRRFEPEWADVTTVLFGDGSTRWMPRNTSEATWRAMATRAGSEKLKLP